MTKTMKRDRKTRVRTTLVRVAQTVKMSIRTPMDTKRNAAMGLSIRIMSPVWSEW